MCVTCTQNDYDPYRNADFVFYPFPERSDSPALSEICSSYGISGKYGADAPDFPGWVYCRGQYGSFCFQCVKVKRKYKGSDHVGHFHDRKYSCRINEF